MFTQLVVLWSGDQPTSICRKSTLKLKSNRFIYGEICGHICMIVVMILGNSEVMTPTNTFIIWITYIMFI